MNKDTYRMLDQVRSLGISAEDAFALRRISMTLHRWHEMECGVDNGCITRDEETEKPFWQSSYSGRLTPIADREKGARKRLAAIMARYPHLTAYVQGDPAGGDIDSPFTSNTVTRPAERGAAKRRLR